MRAAVAPTLRLGRELKWGVNRKPKKVKKICQNKNLDQNV